MDELINKNILGLLPHRPPFVFVDEILRLEEDSIIAVRTFNEDEEYFKGHFPGNPIVPGVLLIESMAQTSGLLVSNILNQTENDVDEGNLFYLSRVEIVRFKEPVFPGQKVKISAELMRLFANSAKFSASCDVDGKNVARCELILTKKVSKKEGEV